MRSVQRQLLSVSRRSLNVRTLQRVQTPFLLSQCRMITDRSFAAEHLKSQGVQVDPAPEEPPIEVDGDMVNRPTERVQKLLDGFMELNILEVAMFIKAMQKTLGISDDMLSGPPRAGGDGESAAAQATPVVEEKTIFEIKLKGFDAKAKIKIIKEVRAITGLGLKEAKELVEKAPVTLKDNIGKEEGENLIKVLQEAGAEVELV